MWSFDSYGAQKLGSLVYNNMTPNPDTVGFAGQQGGYYDTDERSNLMTHRWYDPGTGRFVNRDPLGYGGGLNVYGYAGGNPITNSDPSGLDPNKAQMGPVPANEDDQKMVRGGWIDAHQLLVEFAYGWGPKHSIFLASNYGFTPLVEKMSSLDPVRAKIISNAQQGIETHQNMNFNYGNTRAIERLPIVLADGIEMATNSSTIKNEASSFLGSYYLYVQTSHLDRSRHEIQVDFHLFNVTDIASLTRNPLTGYEKGYQPIIPDKSTGYFHTQTQDVYWSERLHF